MYFLNLQKTKSSREEKPNLSLWIKLSKSEITKFIRILNSAAVAGKNLIYEYK